LVNLIVQVPKILDSKGNLTIFDIYNKVVNEWLRHEELSMAV